MHRTQRLSLDQFFSPDDLQAVIAEHLPAWKKACHADANEIAFHVEAFGASGTELLLLACAIKYAALQGKNVHIACGTGKAKRSPEGIVSAQSVVIYREEAGRSSRRSATAGKKKRGQKPRSDAAVSRRV
jgi:hypothetical protein